MVNASVERQIALAAIAELRAPSATALIQPADQARQAIAAVAGNKPRAYFAENFLRTNDLEVQVVTRIAEPFIVVMQNILTAGECDELVRLSRLKVRRSTIVDPLSGEYRVIDDRSSQGTFFAVNENAFIAKLDRRISEVMNSPVENGEGLQILNYQVGGEYKPHFDYFPPDDPGSQPHLLSGGQRVSTLIIYLNDVEDGGETIFPKVNLAVCPRKGSAVYFEYCNQSGLLDPMTLHGGSLVRQGEKWIATKWMRQFPYENRRNV